MAAKKKHRISLQDLKNAEMDMPLQTKLRRRGGGTPVLAGEDLLAVQRFARMTISIARQRNKDITEEQLVKNLTANLKKVTPGMRKIMLEQMKAYVDEQ